MTVQEAKQQAKDRGFTHVKTYGGLVSLDDWTPYGGYDKVRMDWYAENKLIDGVDKAEAVQGFAAGIWTLSLEVTPCH